MHHTPSASAASKIEVSENQADKKGELKGSSSFESDVTISLSQLIWFTIAPLLKVLKELLLRSTARTNQLH